MHCSFKTFCLGLGEYDALCRDRRRVFERLRTKFRDEVASLRFLTHDGSEASPDRDDLGFVSTCNVVTATGVHIVLTWRATFSAFPRIDEVAAEHASSSSSSVVFPTISLFVGPGKDVTQDVTASLAQLSKRRGFVSALVETLSRLA